MKNSRNKEIGNTQRKNAVVLITNPLAASPLLPLVKPLSRYNRSGRFALCPVACSGKLNIWLSGRKELRFVAFPEVGGLNTLTIYNFKQF